MEKRKRRKNRPVPAPAVPKQAAQAVFPTPVKVLFLVIGILVLFCAVTLFGALAFFYTHPGLIADHYYSGEDYDKAIRFYTKAIERDPENPQWYASRAMCHYDKDSRAEYQASVNDFNQAVALTLKAKKKPEYDTWFYRGCALRHLGLYAVCLPDLNHAVETDPQNAYAYINRGLAYLDLQKLDLALSDESKAIDLDPEIAWAYEKRGSILEKMGKPDQALQDYEKATRVDDEDADAYCDEGYLLEKKGRYQDAVLCFTQAVQADSDLRDAYLGRADAYDALGITDKSRQDLESAKKLEKPDEGLSE